MSGEDQGYSRKGFFNEFFTQIRKGVGNHVDRKLAKMLDAPLRPPGALDEVEFLSACTRCNHCVEACPYQAIQKMPLQSGVGANSPYIDPDVRSCELCPDLPCITACNDGALLPTTPEKVSMGRAVIVEEKCHTYQDKVCTLCYDACPFPETAITLDDYNFHPKVLDGCVGCGVCQQRCPVYPVGIKVLSPVNYRARKVEEEHYFGFIDRGDDD